MDYWSNEKLSNAKTRWDNVVSNPNLYTIANYLTYGLTGNNIRRYDDYRDDPNIYGFGNWLSSGYFDRFIGAVNPDSTFSPEHWEDSFITAGTLGLMGVGIYELLAAAKAAATVASTQSGAEITLEQANKIIHLFNNKNHQLDILLDYFEGDQLAAFRAIENAAQQYVIDNNIHGIISKQNLITVQIADFSVTVRGNVIDGVMRIGTAFIQMLKE